MPRQKTVGLAILALLKQYPHISNTEAARQLHQLYPEIYPDVERTRTVVRYYRGAQGDSQRNIVRPEDLQLRFSAPPSDAKPYQPHVISSEQPHPILITGDWHVPYHDRDALETMIDYAIQQNVKTIILNGDICDMHQASHYCKDPTLRDIVGELDMTRKLLIDVKAATGADIVFKEGNHEARYDRYLMERAPEAFKFKQTRLRALLDLESIGMSYVEAMQIIYYRQLTIIHGHEYVMSINNPVSPARGLMLRAKKSAICSHHHRTSYQPSNDIRGGIQGAWSIGCMCDLHPAFMPLNDWNIGFAIVRPEDADMFTVENKTIVRNKIL